jgi:hypothetical protein
MPRNYPTTNMCDGALLARFESRVRDSDVFVSTAAKCGQTWLQTLLVHLKTRGLQADLGGKGLGAVSPWLELPGSAPFGHRIIDRDERLAMLDALDAPRIFKMHVIWEEIPRPPGSRARVMTITRDPRDVPYSMFAHLQSLNLGDGKGPPEDFDAYFEQWMDFGFYFHFMRSFWPHRDDADVLWLRYEDMHRDLRAQIGKILSFLDWSLDEADVERVLPLVDFAHMRASEKSEIFVEGKSVWKEGRNFFREGAVGKNRERLSAEQSRRIVERTHAELGEECARFLLDQR